MDNSGDLAALALSILDTNLYMTLGTADESGTPWVSCPRDAGQPCAEHGRPFDHRTNVTL